MTGNLNLYTMIQITKFFRDLLIAFFIITVVGAFNISISQCDIFQDFETSFLQDWSILNGTVSLSQNASVSGISSIKMSGVGYYSSIISNQDTFGYGSYSVWFMETGPFTDAYFRFHYQNSSNFYQLAMMPQNTDNPKLKLVKVVNGNTTTLAQIAPIFGTNQWFKMAVDRYDNGDINVFINDSLQISVNDTTLMTPSSIVFMAWDYTTYMDDFCYKIYPDTSSVNNAINLGNDIIACEGDSIQINAGNSLLNYVWNNGLAFGNILNVTTSGSYFVQAIDFGGTIYSDTIIVTFFPNPFIDLGNDTTICPNDTVIISSGSTGYNYIWSTTETTESITVMPSVSSNFILVAESNGCYSSDVIAVNVIDSISASLINDTLLCDGNYIVLYPSGSNNSYVWSTDQSSDSIIVNSTGMYSVTATNMCGLTASDSVFVLVLQVPSVNLGSNQDFCTGDSVSLSCNVPYSDYLWSTAETTQSIYVNSTGYYFVIVSNICGTASDVVFVNEINPPVLNLADTSICYGDTAYLNSFNSGCNFIWSTGDTSQVISVSPSSSQIYSVSVSNSGCSVVDSVMVNILPSPNVEIGADTIICIKDTVILDAGNTGASYSWSTGSTNQSIEIYPISPELIWVEVSMFGCETTDTVFIDIFPDSVVQLGSDTAFCFGGTLAINAGNPGSTYQWSNGETSQQIIINNAGFYSVWVSNQCGESDEY